jgi:cation-transporting P-type ATPase I
VVVDDRIETIADAVLEVSAMCSSVREAVAILVGGSLGEIGFIVGGTLLGGRPPLNARQMLLVNLLTLLMLLSNATEQDDEADSMVPDYGLSASSGGRCCLWLTHLPIRQRSHPSPAAAHPRRIPDAASPAKAV